MRNIVLRLAYDGTNYHGWQCQPNVPTIQETLTKAAERILNQPVKIHGAGRTDTGVHAMAQVANLHTDRRLEPKNLVRALNSVLPKDIRVQDCWEEDASFHARYSAKSKTYVYCIFNAPANSPFLERYVWHIPHELDVEAMGKALRTIIGEHDFSSFKKQNEIYKSTVRLVMRARLIRRGRLIYFIIEAQGFLRYMVRNIVGTLVPVGSGKITVHDFMEILGSKDRVAAGPTAPARGLFLRRIVY